MVVYHGFHALNNSMNAISKCKKLLNVFYSHNKIILIVTSIVSASLDLDFFLIKKWFLWLLALSVELTTKKIQVIYFL